MQETKEKVFEEGVRVADYPGFLSEAHEFIEARHHFAAHGGEGYHKFYDLKKGKRTELYAEVLQPLVVESTKVIAYPYLDDADEFLREPLFKRCGSQWLLNSSFDDLIQFLISQIYNGGDNFSLTLLFECIPSEIEWDRFFRSCFDPMLLNNPSVVCSASALKHSKRIGKENKVSIILHRQPLAYPIFLIVSSPMVTKNLFEIAAQESVISERFRTMYQHLKEA